MAKTTVRFGLFPSQVRVGVPRFANFVGFVLFVDRVRLSICRGRVDFSEDAPYKMYDVGECVLRVVVVEVCVLS